MSKVYSFIFTRYLYEKEEVEIHLLLSLLYKKQEDALFWAYELFYSGFEIHLLQYLLKIYYYFYACLNNSLENFLIKKIKEFIKSPPEIQSKIIASIIQNLIIRPLNMDVFLFYIIPSTFEIFEPDPDSFTSSSSSLNHLWEEIFKQGNKVNVELFLYVIFKSNFQDTEFLLKNLIDYLELDLDLDLNINKEKFWMDYKKNVQYIVKQLNWYIDEKIILLSRIVYLYGLKTKKKMGKKLYICVNSIELVMYETIEVDPVNNVDFPAYKILPIATILAIEPDVCKSLFHLKREKEDIQDAYLNHWLFYASNTPLWTKRIQDFKGIVCDEEKKVIFKEEQDEGDNLLQAFYDNYGFEPDEQKKEIQNKCIGDRDRDKDRDRDINKTWFSIYKDCGFLYRFIDIDDEYMEQLETLDKNKIFI